MVAGASDIGQRLGIAVVVFLITLIGGRIIPSFTRNWLNKRGATALPTPFNRFDAICIGAGGITLLLWASGMQNAVTSAVLLIAGILHAARLTRWQGHQTWRSPILLMLHIAYGFIPLGLIALAVAAPVVGLHLLGVGAIGGMTLAVMMRATMGHTGRDLTAGGLLTAAFALLITAALIRSLAGTITIAGTKRDHPIRVPVGHRVRSLRLPGRPVAADIGALRDGSRTGPRWTPAPDGSPSNPAAARRRSRRPLASRTNSMINARCRPCATRTPQ